jgi:hypothetical protein
LKRYWHLKLPNESLVYVIINDRVYQRPILARTVEHGCVVSIDVEVNGKFYVRDQDQFFTELWEVREELKRLISGLNKELTDLFWGEVENVKQAN